MSIPNDYLANISLDPADTICRNPQRYCSSIMLYLYDCFPIAQKPEQISQFKTNQLIIGLYFRVDSRCQSKVNS